MISKLDSEGRKFTVAKEGKRNQAYQDTVGVWTIGYGCIFMGYPSGRRVVEGDYLNDEQVEALHEQAISYFETELNTRVKGLGLNQNQYNALFSLIYNVGPGNLDKSPVLKEIKRDKNSAKLKAIWENYALNGGKLRRQTEYELYKRPMSIFATNKVTNAFFPTFLVVFLVLVILFIAKKHYKKIRKHTHQ